MPTLEFATINLNLGVKADDPKLLSVLHACISEISKADGVSNMHFIKNNPQGTQEQILGLVGVWASVEAHSAFLESGKMLPLLMDLKDFITMRDVMHLKVEKLSPSESKLISSNLVCAIVTVKALDKAKLDHFTDKMLSSNVQAVAGWKMKKEKSFQKAEEFGREKFGQAAKETAPEDVDTWVVFLPEDEKTVVDKVVENTGQIAQNLEIQHWVRI